MFVLELLCQPCYKSAVVHLWKEIDRCEEIMKEAIGDRILCITLHPGFESVCLNRHVLEVAALGLKTRAGKSYTTVREQSNKSDNE